MVLEREGYYVKIASTYEEAESALEEQPFDLAVVDIMLKPSDKTDRGGLRLLDDVLPKYEGLEAIVATGHGTLEDASKYTREGKAYTFIEKQNFRADDFREAIKTAIARAAGRAKADKVLGEVIDHGNARRHRAEKKAGD